MNVYLAGPMSGYPEYNFPAFHAAAKKLRDKGHFVFNPAESNPAGEGTKESYRACMAVDLAWICAHAEAIAVLPMWHESDGARTEVVLAHCLDLPVLDVHVMIAP